jgi:methylenetetrahydrofolate reductase (NADPH)
MAESKTRLQQRIEDGKPILLAEMSPPAGSDPGPVRAAVKRCAGKVHALGISDNRDHVCMAALAAASLCLAEGVEPVLHIATRDRNRIALASEALGAQALGIRNLLCTTGTHQTLGACTQARNVFDVDPIQLLAMYKGLAQDASVVGEERIATAGPFCLGATASPYGEPQEMQVIHLAKAVAAGATFVITQPVFDMERFEGWWREVTKRGLQEKVAIIAGIQPLASAETAKAYAARRPSPRIPNAMLQRIAAKGDAKAQRAAGIELALETIHRLKELKGLRGFEIRADGDADIAVELIEKSGLGAN